MNACSLTVNVDHELERSPRVKGFNGIRRELFVQCLLASTITAKWLSETGVRSELRNCQMEE